MCGCRRTGKGRLGNQAAFFFFVRRQLRVPDAVPRGAYVSRAAARSIISPRRICAGAILSFMKAQDFRRRGVRRAGIERRRGIVFEAELDGLRGLSVVQQRDQRQREIDACGDAAAGDAVAVDADARLGRDRAERASENPSPSSASPRDNPSAGRRRRAPVNPCRPR